MATAVKCKVFQAVARAFADNGVDTMFGITGDTNMYMVDSFIRDCGGTYVAAAHEQGCCNMAYGYAAVSNKVGVCTVTHGAATTNTITALIDGVRSALPMVLVCGDTDPVDRENLHKVYQRDFIMPTGAGFEPVRAPHTVAEDVARALRRTRLERRPIVLKLGHEFDWADTVYEPVRADIPETLATVTAGDDIDTAVGIIASAKRPLILAGRGAASPAARTALLALAARIDAPLATTLKGKDLFRGEPFNLGICGTVSHPVAVDTILASDCIIAFGAGLNKLTLSNGTFAKGKRFIQVNRDGTQIGRYQVPHAGLVGDCAVIADLLRHWLDEAEIAPSGFRSDDLREKLAAQAAARSPRSDNGDGTVDHVHALEQLDRLLPANRIYVSGVGRFMFKAWTTFNVADPASFVSTASYASIGLGMGYAIGAACAAQGRPTVLIEGDGGFMHGGLAEFNTAVRRKLDIIVALCNDRAYGAEHMKFRAHQMDPSNIFFDWPEFAQVAVALGGEGVTVRSDADWAAVEQAVARRRGPLLIDIRLDPELITV